MKKGLGKGLDALFQIEMEPEQTVEKQTEPEEISIFDIDPNPDQPRKHFDMEKLEELASSIRTHGILQPLLLVQRGSRFLLVAGERRWRAARMAGLSRVPALVRSYSQEQMAEISLIENLQRDDLNALEEAEGIRTLMERYNMTQEQVAERLGRSRPAVTNALRILSLPQEVRQMIRDNLISAGHARCLAGLPDATKQIEMARRVVSQGLSVRQLEVLTKQNKQAPEKPAKQLEQIPEFDHLEGMLRTVFGTRAQVAGTMERGRIVVEYFNREDLERIYDVLASMNQSSYKQ